MNNLLEGLTYDGDYRDRPVVSNVQCPFLISRTLLLVSISDGILPDVNDILNNNVMLSLMAGADSLNILAGILSKPVALLVFTLLRSLCTSSDDIVQNENVCGAVLTWFKNNM